MTDLSPEISTEIAAVVDAAKAQTGSEREPMAAEMIRLMSGHRDVTVERGASLRGELDGIDSQLAILQERRTQVVAEINHVDSVRDAVSHTIISLGGLLRALPANHEPEKLNVTRKEGKAS